MNDSAINGETTPDLDTMPDTEGVNDAAYDSAWDDAFSDGGQTPVADEPKAPDAAPETATLTADSLSKEQRNILARAGLEVDDVRGWSAERLASYIDSQAARQSEQDKFAAKQRGEAGEQGQTQDAIPLTEKLSQAMDSLREVHGEDFEQLGNVLGELGKGYEAISLARSQIEVVATIADSMLTEVALMRASAEFPSITSDPALEQKFLEKFQGILRTEAANADPQNIMSVARKAALSAARELIDGPTSERLSRAKLAEQTKDRLSRQVPSSGSRSPASRSQSQPGDEYDDAWNETFGKGQA